MATVQSAQLDRKKLMADPVMVTTICVLVVFLALFILYPLAILLVDSFITESGPTLEVFQRILAMVRRLSSMASEPISKMGASSC